MATPELAPAPSGVDLEGHATWFEAYSFAEGRWVGRELPLDDVGSSAIAAANVALAYGCEDLGIARPRVRWFGQSSALEFAGAARAGRDLDRFIGPRGPAVGLARRPGREIWLLATEPPYAIAETALHELRHIFDFDRGADAGEQAAYAYERAAAPRIMREVIDVAGAVEAAAAKSGRRPGSFAARFMRFDVVDEHGELWRPWSIDAGEVLIEPWMHGGPRGQTRGRLPIGRAKVRVGAEYATVEGAFWLDTPGGVAAYRSVKQAGALVRWSATYRIVHSERRNVSVGDRTVRARVVDRAEIWGVAPALRGAAADTGTLYIT